MVNDWENEGGAIRADDDVINVNKAIPPVPDPRLIRIIKDEPGHIEKFIAEDMFSYRTFLFIIVVQLWVIIFKLYGVY